MIGLNRKYRPQTFEEVVGQNITIKILNKVIETRSFKNVYLFSGKTGAGKTTCARIFANKINNNIGTPIEIDAASNNGVDDIRAIIESANQRALVGEYKIYIIDECHTITSQGWQAFLKGIEEPPKYTIFIFCTTEPTKIPATVLNRMQRYNFTNITMPEIQNRLEYICAQEGFINYQQTCEYISKISQGSMRDAITYLEQCSDLSKDLSLNIVKEVLGDFSFETMLRLTNNIIDKDEAAVLKLIDTLYNNGQDLRVFISTYLDFTLDLTKYILFKDITYTNIPTYLEKNEDNSISVVYTTSFDNNLAFYTSLTNLLLDIKTTIKNDPAYKSTIEVMLLKAVR